MGVLRSQLFQGDARLEDCAAEDAAHVTLGASGAFVGKIQQALFLIDTAVIAPTEIGASLYGPSTAAAVLRYKRSPARRIINPAYQTQPDNIVGKMTIAFLDREMVALEQRPAPPPSPVPPSPDPVPLGYDAAKRQIKAYLGREAKRNVADLLLAHAANLLVFGEFHRTGDQYKAFLLFELAGRTRLRRPTVTHFHASERFFGNQAVRGQISAVLQANPLQMAGPIARLSEDLRPFIPVLAAANSFPDRRYGILPCRSTASGEDARHRAIFDDFRDSAVRCPDVPPMSIGTMSRGNILLGLRHAARLSVIGHPVATTCGLLIAGGFSVHAIRLTVPFTTLDPGAIKPESLELRLLGSTDERLIDALAIVEDVASGRSFYADVTKPDSPFAKLKLAISGRLDIPFNQLFDAIVHLGQVASL